MRTIEEAIEAGDVVAWPSEIEVDTHPGAVGAVAYLAAEPMQLGAPDGSSRRVGAGDVLHAAEVEHAGTALARMLRHHQIVAVPADRGVVGLARVLLARCDRLEQLLADAARGSAA